jgi:1-pyrroline-2-carboxylate reductase [NAD(P)H]
MRVIEAQDVHRVLTFPALVEALRSAFGGPAGMPRRMVFKLEEGSHDAFAVLPAWTGEVIGVKAFTYLPSNTAKGHPILHSKILLFERDNGRPLALVDGTSVTYWRTAAVAALAADHLARADAARLLVCGTGNLAPYLALAHAAVRPIREIGIWGRNAAKAEAVVADLSTRRPDLTVRVEADLEGAARRADVISCVTGSHDPIIRGAWLQPGVHADFIGNHERDGRECDTETITRSRVYVDSKANVLNECGELLIPIAEGVFTEEQIVGELADLASGRVKGRSSDTEITVFKSVGTALADLAGAQLVAARMAAED